MTAQELVNKAIAYYNERTSWTYCHGSTGQTVGSSRVEALYKWALNAGKNTTGLSYDEWSKEHGKNIQTTDCSNFINLLIFGEGCNSNWSTESFAAMEKCDPTPGCIAYKYGHVGICTGIENGDPVFVHMPYYERSFESFKLSQAAGGASYWTSYHKLPAKYVKYADAKPVSITATVNQKTRYIGDVVLPEDFTVIVKMSDDSVLTNPPGWQYTPAPFVLANTANVVAVVYAGLVAYVNVPAEIRGTFYGCQIPADSKKDALDMQTKLIKSGYKNVAVVTLT